MSAKIRTRMGDGELVAMSPSEIREDIAVGTRDAAGKAGVPELTDEEQERLYEIIADPSRIVSVAPGDEVVVTDDGVPGSLYCGQDDSGAGIPLSRGQATLTYERVCAADTVSLGHSDYSFKPVKNVISDETNEYYNISMGTTAPFIYGAQPNLGSYYQPDGPVRNPADLLLGGDVKAAQEAQEEAAEKMRQDILYCGRKLNDVGCEGLNLDTSASGGDADFMGTLQVVSELKEEAPGMPVIVGASGEFVLGMHGEVTFNDKQLAGMYPHDQVKVAEEAGVSIYGVAIGTSTNESLAWNVARSVTFTKAAVSAANIPVHVNVGMGVGGVPMCEVPPVDALTRATKSLVELGKADGLQVGVGDPYACLHHIVAAGMGGIRTTGDLVAWMQLARKMKITEAKQYVADKLGIEVSTLTDEEEMRRLREELGIGTIISVSGSPKGILAKIRISELLGIPINSVELFKSQLS